MIRSWLWSPLGLLKDRRGTEKNKVEKLFFRRQQPHPCVLSTCGCVWLTSESDELLLFSDSFTREDLTSSRSLSAETFSEILSSCSPSSLNEIISSFAPNSSPPPPLSCGMFTSVLQRLQNLEFVLTLKCTRTCQCGIKTHKYFRNNPWHMNLNPICPWLRAITQSSTVSSVSLQQTPVQRCVLFCCRPDKTYQTQIKLYFHPILHSTQTEWIERQKLSDFFFKKKKKTQPSVKCAWTKVATVAVPP